MSLQHAKLIHKDLNGSCVFGESTGQFDHMVIIPVYNENSLNETLYSLINMDDVLLSWGVLLLINQGKEVSDKIQKTNLNLFEKLKAFAPAKIELFILYITDIPTKIAGVGTARKIAMEQAGYMLKNDQAAIINLDADCTVSSNYLSAIDKSLRRQPDIDLINIFFEHRMTYPEYTDYIIAYELHLRYFIGIQRWLKLPFAYHTVGSSFAVRRGAYNQTGGMNKRKAGEDFYFIQKYAKKGTIGECNECTVYPSNRKSDRVPFGTGRAILEMSDKKNILNTYNIESFVLLKEFISKLQEFYTQDAGDIIMDQRMTEFFRSVNYIDKIRLIKSNVKSFRSFAKAIFQWFDAFMLMKYTHFMRDNHFSNISIHEAMEGYYSLSGWSYIQPNSSLDLLSDLRKRNRVEKYNGISEVLALFPNSQ